MQEGLDITAFLKKSGTLPVIDVRTPSEFRQGHIPGAHNIPLFSDEERKRVGTTYKFSGQKEAVMMGLELAGPKMKALAKQAGEIAVDGRLLVHCWRGGMRSSSMAWLFGTVGIKSFLLKGGYKSFRRHVLEFLKDHFPFIVIGGLTGSGKTDALRALEDRGEHVLDLEKLAHHKGSAFGALGESKQESNEQFENDIYWQLSQMDRRRRIWVEDESSTIGRNTLPAGIYKSIRTAPVILLDVALQERIERLVREYAKFPKEDLIESVHKIRPRLGDQVARQAIDNIREGAFHKTAEMVLHYYDKTYSYGLGRREPLRVFTLGIKGSGRPAEMAERILQFLEKTPYLYDLCK